MNHLGRFARAAARVARTRYPGFIFGLPPRRDAMGRDEIPVFTYHDVEPADLSRDLEFLKCNGYRTLGLDEYLEARGEKLAEKSTRGRRVLLTFDDARRSFWQVAMPLLRTFEARAVLFAPSHWMTLPLPPAGPLPAAGHPDDSLFMSWEQLRACVASGLVDVQSHAHRHALVPVSQRLVDFANPQALARFDIYDWPMRFLHDAEELGRPAPGTPVYRSTPLLSAERCYVPDAELTQLCREFVGRSGGNDFFSQPDWRVRLRTFHRSNFDRMAGRFMQPVQLRELLESEFERSRAQFQLHLGYAPSCIAYPWMLGSVTSLQLAQRSGLRVAFGVALDYAAERRRSRLPIAVFGRLKCDWLQFLPGERRSSVFATMGRKLTGFAKVQHLAH